MRMTRGYGLQVAREFGRLREREREGERRDED